MGYLSVVITSDSKPKILQASVLIKESTKQLNALNFSCPNCQNCQFQLKISFDENPLPVTPKQPVAKVVEDNVAPGPSSSQKKKAVKRTAVFVVKNEVDERPKVKVARQETAPDPLEAMFLDGKMENQESDGSSGESIFQILEKVRVK